MAIALNSGPYTATLGGNALGTTETGYEKVINYHEEEIRSDEFGDAPVDAIQQGADVSVRCTCIEYSKYLAALDAQAGTAGVANENVGVQLSELADELVLTAVLATTVPQTLTVPLAIVSREIVEKLASKCRRGPLTFKCLPDSATGVVLTEA